MIEGPLLLRHTKLDIGIRVVGVAVGAVTAIFFLFISASPRGDFGLGVIFFVIIAGLSTWGGFAVHRYTQEVVEIGASGISFTVDGRPVPWTMVERVESRPSRHALIVIGGGGVELGTIPFALQGFADGLVLLLRELGERNVAPFGAGRMVIERERSLGALLGSTAMLLLPAYYFVRFSVGRGIWYLAILLGGLVYLLYRRSGSRRLELDIAGVRWRSREESGEFAWSELLLVGLQPAGQEYVSGPALILFSRQGEIVALPLDDLDIGVVAAFLRVSAPMLWEEAFLHGEPLAQRIKSLAAMYAPHALADIAPETERQAKIPRPRVRDLFEKSPPLP